MKRITALIMMALLITIGGVYASWIYSEGVTGESAIYIKDMNNIHMDTVNKDGQKGAITLDYSNAKFVVEDSTGNHDANLNVSGTLVFKFVPNHGASVDAIDVQYKVAISDISVTWLDATDNTQKQLLTTTITDWVDVGTVDATNGVTINATDLGVSLGGDFDLPTYADYASFQAKLNSLSIVVYVREKVTA